MASKPKVFLAMVLMCWLMAACASTPTATVTPAPTNSATPPATVTSTPTSTPPAPTLTNVPTEVLVATPTDQPVCTNLAEFVADVTVPDNTNFNQGEAFTKTWRIRNAGTCTWNQRFLLVFLKGDQMSAPGSLELSETLPGANVEDPLKMVAPTKDGVFQGVYQFQDQYGKRFAMKDGNLWVKIIVGSGTPAPTTSSTTPVVSTSTPTSAAAGGPTSTPGVSGSCSYTENLDFETQIFTLINAARSANGLPAFTLDGRLSSAALKHSIDMGCNSFLKHTGSDGSSPKFRVAAQGYSAASIQEGIYAQPPQFGGTPQSAVDWWLNDALHRPILLSSTLTQIGVGYVNVPTSSLGGYFTIDVATP